MATCLREAAFSLRSHCGKVGPAKAGNATPGLRSPSSYFGGVGGGFFQQIRYEPGSVSKAPKSGAVPEKGRSTFTPRSINELLRLGRRNGRCGNCPFGSRGPSSPEGSKLRKSLTIVSNAIFQLLATCFTAHLKIFGPSNATLFLGHVLPRDHSAQSWHFHSYRPCC